jgi:TonB family protein
MVAFMSSVAILSVGGTLMLFNLKKKVLWLTLLTVVAGVLVSGSVIGAQEQAKRKQTKDVQPVYPPLAGKLNLAGSVKIMLQVNPDGKVKSVHTVGGNPILVAAAEDAVKQWRFEVSQNETSEAVEIKFVRPQ